MVKIETSKTVNASQEKIFSLITDFEKLPERFPSRYRSLKVIDRSENSVSVEEDVTVAGREIHQITKHTMIPKHYLKSEVIDGDTKGTVVEIRLEPEGHSSSDNKTKVSINADLKLGKLGAVLGVFAKGKIKGGLDRMIEEFGNVVNKEV
jgi:ribosome-associated toxin RatA of RatAB toxin-antitoxin module